MRCVALTHAPSPRMNACERTFIAAEPIDLARVTEQHAAYERALERRGFRVEHLEVNLDHPDCVFIEDTAIVLDDVAVLTSMGTASRAGEPRGIEPFLRAHRDVVRVESPLEGGDVLRVGRTLLVGLSTRTSREGVEALRSIARPRGYRVEAIPVTGCLHLKTACTALPDGRLLANRAWIDPPEGFAVVDVAEPDAANVVLLGDVVLMPAAHPRTIERVRGLGFEVDTVDVSELAKAEGCVTCLSVLIE